MFNSLSSGLLKPRYYKEKVEVVAGVPDIEIGRISLIYFWRSFSKKFLYMQWVKVRN